MSLRRACSLSTVPCQFILRKRGPQLQLSAAFCQVIVGTVFFSSVFARLQFWEQWKNGVHSSCLRVSVFFPRPPANVRLTNISKSAVFRENGAYAAGWAIFTLTTSDLSLLSLKGTLCSR